METDGRDKTTGRFMVGHRFGKGGNPFQKQQARLRAVLYEEVSEEKLRAMIRKHAELAENGDKVSFKILLEHMIGKPVATVHLSGADGEKLAGLSLADVQLAVVEALADEPGARIKVAAKLKELHERSSRNGGTA
jgi:hypothetical protein